MSDSYVFDHKVAPINSIDFEVLNNNDILKMSAFGKESIGIDTNELYDKNNPRIGGLLDPRLGTSDNNIVCDTCGLNTNECPGHFGHITLAEKTFNIAYIDIIKKILGCVCIECSKLLVYKNEEDIIDMKKNKSGKRRLDEIKQLVKGVHYCQKKNFGCGAPVWNIKKEMNKTNGKIQMKAEIDIKKMIKDGSLKESGNQQIESAMSEGKTKLQILLSPAKCARILKNISDKDLEIMGIDPTKSRPENMIHSIFPVPPVQVRPSVKADFMSSASTMEDSLTSNLASIIRHNIQVRDEKEDPEKDFSFKSSYNFIHLQLQVATFINNEISSLPPSTQNGVLTKSISSRLSSKHGRIRGNLMGKRVNFSARTVITPDPTIDINELGVPVKIAMRVTFPEIVTPNNKEWLQKLVKNGPNNYPGANMVVPLSMINNNGNNVRPWDLRFKKDKIDLRVGDIVERHLLNGDYVLLNRQPTLHKLSMMGHKCKIIDNQEYKTFRLNLAITEPYNADFDGDEMNIFVPQSDQSIIELEELADAKRHIVSARNSLPIIGPVQDAILGAYNLTAPNMDIDWRTAMNIISYTSIDNFKDFKKNKKYTGKELFSMIIPNKITTSRAGIKVKKGKLIEGQIGKTHVKKENSLIHLIWDLYGTEETKNFIDNIQRLTNNFNLYRGFTVGIRDIIISKEIQQEIDVLYQTKKLEVLTYITEMENNPELIDPTFFENQVSTSLNQIRDTATKLIKQNADPDNNFIIMVSSGSKGSLLNIGLMGGCLGQQDFEGSRIHKNVNGRSLPYFHQNDDGPWARGYIPESYISGLSLESFILHNMSSREGLIDTAIKTAQTGYIQRRLIKFMEDAMIKYDNSVRSANNGIIQFIYGDSGINSIRFSAHKTNLCFMSNKDVEDKFKFNSNEIGKFKNFSQKQNEEYYKKILNLRDSYRTAIMNFSQEYMILPDKFMIPVNLNRIIDTYKDDNSKNDLEPSYVLEHLEKLLDYKYTQVNSMTTNEANNKKSNKLKDELVCKSMFEYAINEWLAPKVCIKEHNFSKEQFDMVFNDIVKSFNKSIVEPGEMVGILSAQSIGEPLTQLTLNTFHQAGVVGAGATNLGVARINELLSFSKDIKEPIMKIYLDEESRYDKNIANKVASYIKFTSLKDLTNRVDIYHDPNPFRDNSITKNDNVKQFHSISHSSKGCQENIENTIWLIRLEIDREKMVTNNISLLDIKSKFCNYWENRFNTLKNLKKEEKNLLNKIDQISVLSNKDESETPVIHFRIKSKNYSYSSLLEFYDKIIEKFKLSGLDGINRIQAVKPEDIITFDEKTGEMVKKSEYVIYTEGINITDLQYLNHIAIERVYCNDVVLNSELFGIEAARYSLFKEISMIIKNINYQHLAILIDIMTCRGALITVDRNGMAKIDSDPLSRSSFEKTIEQFVSASVFGEKDHMTSVSSRIMAGLVIKGGTGLCDVIVDLDKIRKSERHKTYEIAESKFTNITTNNTVDDIINNEDVDDDEFNFEG